MYDETHIQDLIARLPRGLWYTAKWFAGSVGAASVGNRNNSYRLHAEAVCIAAEKCLSIHQRAVEITDPASEICAVIDERMYEVIGQLLIVVKYGDETKDLEGDPKSCQLIEKITSYMESSPWSNRVK